jgi:hypothetical protein
MKKLLFLCLLTGLLFSIFGQAKKEPAEVTKNKIEAGGFFGYTFNNADLPLATTDFTIPYAKYTFESVQKETNKFFLNGDFGYNMFKTTVDGEAPEGMDVYASRLFVNIDPQMRIYLTKDMMAQKKKKASLREEKEEEEWDDGEAADDGKNRWFVAAGLPVSYEMYTPQYEDADAVTSTFVDLSLNIGYDDNKVDIKKLSPWASFEEGVFGYGFFDYRLVETYYDTDSDTKPLAFGAYGQYAYDSENYVKNSMLKLFMGVKYQMSGDALRIFPWEYTIAHPYVGTYMDISMGLEYAQDITEMINVTAGISGISTMLDDEDGNSINAMNIITKVNYYPMPELNVFGGFGAETHLKEKDSEPDYKLYLGALYTFDLIQMKKDVGKKKVEEETDEEEW